MQARTGQGGRSQAALIRAYHEAWETGDSGLIEQAALELPSGQQFGAHPGQVPALLYQAYTAAAAPANRSRLAAALARAWAYGAEAERAVVFADEAVQLAEGPGQPDILADALDATLLSRWGPDSFAQRLEQSARLTSTAAHLVDPELRLSAYMWRLTTAWECLDVVAVQRQLRALDLLAEETGAVRIAFFAASRRAMHALATADLGVADRLIARTGEIGGRCDEPDVEGVLHNLAASRARRAGDTAALRREAAAFEEYGASEGVPSVSAEAAVWWLEAGHRDRAAELLHQLAGSGLDTVVRNVYFLLTVTSLVEVGSVLQIDDIAADGVRLLEPYAGRAVLNAGAVTFHGVIDDYLFRACQVLGQGDADHWRHHAVVSYERIGATWWKDRLAAPALRAPSAAPAIWHLRQNAAADWAVGRAGAIGTQPDLKGLHYLRHLLRRPGENVTAAELAAAAGGHAGAVMLELSAGEIIDRRALAAYRTRLRGIDDELAEAESWADEARLGRLRLEREALLDQVAAAAGLAGRRRKFSSADERARIAVRKAISATLSRIERQDPALARLLRDAVHTGANCRYDPDPGRPVTWVLDPPERR
jgi:hypothetical protein